LADAKDAVFAIAAVGVELPLAELNDHEISPVGAFVEIGNRLLQGRAVVQQARKWRFLMLFLADKHRELTHLAPILDAIDIEIVESRFVQAAEEIETLQYAARVVETGDVGTGCVEPIPKLTDLGETFGRQAVEIGKDIGAGRQNRTREEIIIREETDTPRKFTWKIVELHAERAMLQAR
jgi:hypothetical protein